MIYGVNPSAALRNISLRKKELAKGLHSKKGRKTAIVVHGGGMRGVFSAGSLIALEKMGFSEGFDAIYSSSSGALNASYFLAGQSAFGTSIYYEDMNKLKVINPFRIKKILDIDYVFDHIITEIKPLNIGKVRNSRTCLYFFATDENAKTVVRFSSKSDDVMTLLKASCALPVYYGKGVHINGSAYFDGGICKPIPLKEAIDDGCTDILVILTHPVIFRNRTGFFEKFVGKLLLSRINPELLDVYLKGFSDYYNSFDISIGKIKSGKNVNITTIVPDDSFSLNRLTKNGRLLKKAAIEGAEKAFGMFNYKYEGEILKY